MPCEIVVDDVARVVRATFRGEVSLEERLSTAREMLVAAQPGAIDRFLCDYRSAQASNARDLDAAHVVEQYISRLPRGSLLAYVLKFDHQLDDAIERLMRAQGMEVERFQDIERRWSGCSRPARSRWRRNCPPMR